MGSVTTIGDSPSTCTPLKRSPINALAWSRVTTSVDLRVGRGAFARASEMGDLLLQQQQPVEQRLRRRWTARHVDVDRNDPVYTLHDEVAVAKRSARVGAGAHRHGPLRIRHLVVDALEH